MNLPKTLTDKLENRKQNLTFRRLAKTDNKGVDFASNDYLGFAQSDCIFAETSAFLKEKNIKKNGATGSRLLTGNYDLYNEAEDFIATFHDAQAALLFNSGYDANLGFFGSVPQRNEIVLYDELCHASIRDGIRLCHAKSYKFAHNDLEDLQELIIKFKNTTIYVVTESVFSMDGDCANLEQLVELTQKYNCFLVVDEAHALGVFGTKGEGLVQNTELHHKLFARIVTFGKGLGCHGAVVLGSTELKDFLINFARSFIYTTGLPTHAVATIMVGYKHLQVQEIHRQNLRLNITYFNEQKNILGLKPLFVRSKSAIQSAIIPGNAKVIAVANYLQTNGFNVKPILSPTVPQGQERLRFCLHSYNTKAQIETVLGLLANALF